MQSQISLATLLTVLLPMLATTVHGGCPKDTDGWHINGATHCLQRGQMCVEVYAEYDFRGPSFNRCSGNSECVTIPHDSVVYNKVSSFRQVGKTGYPNKSLRNDQVKCEMFWEDNCKAGSHGSMDNWAPNFEEQRCWKGAGRDNRMKSYRCFNPLEWKIPRVWDCSGP